MFCVWGVVLYCSKQERIQRSAWDVFFFINICQPPFFSSPGVEDFFSRKVSNWYRCCENLSPDQKEWYDKKKMVLSCFVPEVQKKFILEKKVFLQPFFFKNCFQVLELSEPEIKQLIFAPVPWQLMELFFQVIIKIENSFWLPKKI